MVVTFGFEGGVELEAALSEFARPLAKRVGARALKRAGDPILQLYRSLATVKTGTLQRLEISGTKLTRRQARLAKREGKSGVELYIGTSDPAGGQEEFGNAHQAAHPALRPAWDAEGGQKAVDRIVEELRDDIEKTRARVAKRAR